MSSARAENRSLPISCRKRGGRSDIAAREARTPRTTIRLPRVILLTFFDKLPSKELKLTRGNVFGRDKDTCQYCGKIFPREELNLDHVIPRDRGGKTTWENIVCSCIKCNSRKANRLPHEAHMRLICKPVRPKWRPVISLVLNNQQRERWKDFLDLAYWPAFNLADTSAPSNNVTTNIDGYEGTFKTIEFAANKRYSNRWSMNASYSYTWTAQYNNLHFNNRFGTAVDV